MFNIIFDDEYATVTEFITGLRTDAGISQRGLAEVLGRSQGHIHRMETRQRPVDLVEFCRIARASGVHPAEALTALVERWSVAGLEYAPPDLAAKPIWAAAV